MICRQINPSTKQKVFHLARFYERAYHGCAQSVIAAVQDVLGLAWVGRGTFQAATGLSGGIGCLGKACGAFTGAVLSIGLCVGRERENFRDLRGVHWQNYSLVKELYQRFMSKYGSVTCHDIQKAIFGKSFEFWNPKSLEEFRRLNGHAKCSEVTAQAAKWVLEILDSYQRRIRYSINQIASEALEKYSGFILDLDGTLWIGEAPIPGALEIARALSKLKNGVVILTNNTTLTRTEIAKSLNKMGLNIHEDQILTSAFLTAEFLLKTYGKSSIYLIGNRSFEQELMEMGHEIVSHNKADIVVVGYDANLNYEKMEKALQILLRGAVLVASDLTHTWIGKGGNLNPGSAAAVGAFLGMKFHPHVVVGKPNPLAVEIALEHLGLAESRNCLLIGDDLEVDIRAAFNAGVDSLLVFTGVTRPEDLNRAFIMPNYILNSLAELPVLCH